MSSNSDKKRYIASCPLGCEAGTADTDIVLPEGCLQECSECGQLFSQCSERYFHESMQEFDDPRGTWPPPENSPRLLHSASRLINRLESFSGLKAKDLLLLDVGCSSGAFINAARQLGVSCEGVEPAEKAAKAASEMGLKVHQGFLEDVKLPSERYDVITLFEVIEHVSQPLSLIRECQRLLKNGGLLIIKTANSSSWTVNVLKGDWDYFSIANHGGHVSFFNQRSMNTLAARTGFSMVDFRTHSVSLTDHQTVSATNHKLSKIFAELLNLPSKICGKGQELEVVLKKNSET